MVNTQKIIKLSVVIPCYNESKNIPKLLERFSEVINSNEIEVIIVDNGSTDNTSVVIDKYLSKYPFARMVTVPKNQGYGFGIKSGLREARGDFLGWTHADLQTDPADAIGVLEIIEQYDFRQDIFIKGKRLRRSFVDLLFTAGMTIFESLFFGLILIDINGQPNIFSRAFYETWKNPPDDFSLDLYAYAMAKKRKLKVVRLPVNFEKRVCGESSWNKGFISRLKLVQRTLNITWKLFGEIHSAPKGFPCFIAHRINTIEALKKIPSHHGVELDLRDSEGKIIIEHEPFISGEDFEQYLKCYHHGTMILNIKSERIEFRVRKLLQKYGVKDYFFLDSSFPMIYQLSEEGERNIALRFSDYEGLDTIILMRDRISWVWVDCFENFPLDIESYQTIKELGLKICLVSPELQGREKDIKNYQKIMSERGIVFDAICTKSYNVEKWI